MINMIICSNGKQPSPSIAATFGYPSPTVRVYQYAPVSPFTKNPMRPNSPAHMPRWTQLAAVLVLSFYSAPITGSTAPTCYAGSDTLQWYIDAIGETPCATYQRLRQICNSDYTTPTWNIDATTDQCDDPLSTCCCNSITWSVRMLCINCEWDEFGVNDPGHSAVAGAYYNYRWSSGTPNNGMYCGDGYNQTLPESLQQAVCDRGIYLGDFLYSIFWPDGSWNFTNFEFLAKQDPALHNNQSLDSCTSTSSTPITVTLSGTNTPSILPPTSAVGGKSDTVAVVGGSLGGALGLVLLGAIIVVHYVKRRRLRQSRSAVGVADDRAQSRDRLGAAASWTNFSTNIVTPFVSQSPRPPSNEQISQRTSTPSTHSETYLVPDGSYTSPPTDTSEGDDSPTPTGVHPPNPKRKGKVNRPRRIRRNSVFVQPVTELREHDAEMLLSRLPPEYRTMYSE
ncbi:uncharacterized protein B0H18DRAFT_975092 [Fomitopsis serialis]|uniref:uncharacterized protein n=1 Tax=Fomitopsis serialis TaxID=139415 RepID=UPI002008D0A3|nr:uncharacterized protein B0H18DRAFT_975092 [Neoantrodia serialis]KAH9935280.1 hypothetical protein B0H18DRAFT_975092 [Neoantrodia serialis]